MDKQDIQHWTGEGLPPVGIEVEYKFTEVTYRADFSVGTVLYIGEMNLFMRHKSSGNEFIQPINKVEFRPICTPEQIEAERRERVRKQMFDVWSQAENSTASA
ncbi:hypothetical protein AB6V59_11785 [Serratia fonticola]